MFGGRTGETRPQKSLRWHKIFLVFDDNKL